MSRVVFRLGFTVGGNVGQTQCVFPFIFRGQALYGCEISAYGYWCATTANYDIDGKWGYCRLKG